MKAAARQSLNCIKHQKIKYGEERFSIWRMEFLYPAMWHDRDIVSPGDCTMQYGMWLWNRDNEFIKWQHPTMWYVALGWQPLNLPKRPPYWTSTSGFHFNHITAVVMLFCTSLRNFIQIGPPSAEKWRNVDFQDGGSPPYWILGVPWWVLWEAHVRLPICRQWRP